MPRHTAAYVLLHAVCQWLVAAGNAQLTLQTLPLWLLKIGGLATCVYLRRASSPPVSRAGACSRRTRAVHE